MKLWYHSLQHWKGVILSLHVQLAGSDSPVNDSIASRWPEFRGDHGCEVGVLGYRLSDLMSLMSKFILSSPPHSYLEEAINGRMRETKEINVMLLDYRS